MKHWFIFNEDTARSVDNLNTTFLAAEVTSTRQRNDALVNRIILYWCSILLENLLIIRCAQCFLVIHPRQLTKRLDRWHRIQCVRWVKKQVHYPSSTKNPHKHSFLTTPSFWSPQINELSYDRNPQFVCHILALAATSNAQRAHWTPITDTSSEALESFQLLTLRTKTRRTAIGTCIFVSTTLSQTHS